MRAVIRVDPPLIRDVLQHALTDAGIEVVGSPPDSIALLLAIKERRAEVVFLMASDPDNRSREPGIYSHLLNEFPQLKIVMVSTDGYTITDVGIRTLHCDDLSADSIRASLQTLLAD